MKKVVNKSWIIIVIKESKLNTTVTTIQYYFTGYREQIYFKLIVNSESVFYTYVSHFYGGLIVANISHQMCSHFGNDSKTYD